MKKRFLSLLLIVALCMISILPAFAEDTSSVATDNNVMMVIDGSGSLTNAGGTDVDGLRYEAIDLFLGLLPDKNSHVGAIVFDDSKTLPLNTGLLELKSREDKRTLSKKVRNTKAGGNTDIGYALTTALEGLVQGTIDSDNPNCIIFFSDGETYLPDDAAMKASLKKKEEAIKKAKSLGIPIHCICLNTNNSASTKEVKHIADATGGLYEEIKSADDLSSVFESFYSLIYSEPGIPDDDITDVTGYLSKKFQIPSVGVEEVNVIIRSKKNNLKLGLIQPSGIALSDADIDALSINGSNFQMLKLVDLEPGVWELTVHGDPNCNVKLNWIYNTDLGADIECSIDPDNIPLNSEVEIRGYILNNGKRVTAEAAYSEYRANLVMTNASTEEKHTLTMDKDGASFVAKATLDEYATYYASLSMSCNKVERSSKSIVLNVGNTAPVPVSEVEEDSVSKCLGFGGEKEYDLSEFIKDAEDSSLDFELDFGENALDEDAVSLDGNILKVNLKDVKEGSVYIKATDSQGASCNFKFDLETKDRSPIVLGIIGAVLLIIAGIVIYILTRKPICSYQITVYSFDHNSGYSSQPITQQGFAGKLALTYFQIVECGITGEFRAISGKPVGCKFVAKTPFITEAGMELKSIVLNKGDSLTLYALEAKEDQSKGIHIIVEEDYNSFGY